MLIQSFSGIRGIYGRELTDDTARRYAYSFSEFLRDKIGKEPLIVVGCDTRESSEALKWAVFDSLLDIIDVGVMPVAAVELAVREFKADGGIMITASHNEPEFNGFKFLDNDGAVLRPKDIGKVIDRFKKISKLSEEEFLDKHSYGGELKGKIKKLDNRRDELIDKYTDFLTSIIGGVDNKVNLILDVNGGSGVIIREIIGKIGLINVNVINDKAGKFKRRIEPDKESLVYLSELIKEENAGFAAGFDCDADRVEILLNDGSLVDGNYLLALIVDDLLGKSKGTVVTNDATSNVVRRVAERHDCEVREVEVGEINVVDEMLKLKSPIGGEGSNGGVIIPPSRCRDGILSVMYLLKILNEKGKSLSDLIKELPRYYTIQKKVKLERLLDKGKIKKHYSKYKIQETGDSTGGLKVIIGRDSFVWFRVSKTEPHLLRVIADSGSEAETKRLLAEASSIL